MSFECAWSYSIERGRQSTISSKVSVIYIYQISRPISFVLYACECYYLRIYVHILVGVAFLLFFLLRSLLQGGLSRPVLLLWERGHCEAFSREVSPDLYCSFGREVTVKPSPGRSLQTCTAPSGERSPNSSQYWWERFTH